MTEDGGFGRRGPVSSSRLNRGESPFLLFEGVKVTLFGHGATATLLTVETVQLPVRGLSVLEERSSFEQSRGTNKHEHEGTMPRVPEDHTLLCLSESAVRERVNSFICDCEKPI
jgi:hypothetical protein